MVDVWGVSKSSPLANFDGDSTTCVWSSSKPVAAVCMAILHDRGLLQYDSLVSAYWPEFAQKGKGHLTVRDVMCMEAGLSRLDKPVPIEMTLTENVL